MAAGPDIGSAPAGRALRWADVAPGWPLVSFALLALICAVALAGPLLALARRFTVPVVIGELVVGIALGRTGARVLDPANPTLTFMGEVGFAMVMFLAGTHVPVRDPALRRGLRVGAARAAAIGVLAVPAGFAIARLFGSDHGWLFAVLLASSSAGLVLPALNGVRVGSRPGLELLPQLAIADAACIVALPLAIDPAHAGRAALGTAAVLAAAALLYAFLAWAERTGRRHALHRASRSRGLALELRIVLLALFGLAAIAVLAQISVMLAGFAMGLVVAGIGPPKRIAHQMFALTEGFFGPVFFVWLGASLDLRVLGTHPDAVGLGLVLGLVALALHAAPAALGQPAPLALATASQLGVPVGAAALGTQLGIFAHSEAASLLLGALVTIGALTVLAPQLRALASEPDARAPDAPNPNPNPRPNPREG